jgi:hypothetical protein
MATTDRDEVIRSDVLADLREVARQAAKGGVLDPELRRRVGERAAKARQEVLEKFGVQDIGVQIIREMRDAQ